MLHLSSTPRTTICLLAFAFALSSGDPTTAHAGEPFDRARSGIGWTMTRLDLDVTVDAAGRQTRLKGTARLRLDLDESYGPTLAVNVRRAVMRWVSLETTSANAQIETGLRRSEFPESRFATLRFDEMRTQGDEIDIRFELHSRGRADQFVTHPEFAMASWTEAWHPFAAPRLDRGERYTSKLVAIPGTTTLRLPAGWISHSDGTLTSRDAGNDGTVDVYSIGAEGTTAMARSYVAGRYTSEIRESHGRTVSVCLLGEHALSVEDLADKLGKIMEAQEAKLGPFPFPVYAVTEAPDAVSDAWYASSQQSFIVAKSSAFGYAHGNLPLWAHEMCHGWWGNTVSTHGPGSKVCSESLAQFGAVIAIEALEGRDAMVEFLEFSRSGYSSYQCAKGYFELVREGVDSPLSQLGNSGSSADVTHNLANSKGMWVYHMLRDTLGDDRFYATLRSLVDRYTHAHMSLDDVRHAFIAAAPDAKLERFFAQWLDRGGAPILDATWKPSKDGAFEIELSQVDTTDPFHLDVEIEISFADGETRRETIELRGARATTVIRTEAAIERIRLDPDRRLLIWREAYGPRP